jgi:hypothetical protein
MTLRRGSSAGLLAGTVSQWQGESSEAWLKDAGGSHSARRTEISSGVSHADYELKMQENHK